MKKLFALLLALVMVASVFVGCNTTSNETPSTDNSQQTPSTDNSQQTPSTDNSQQTPSGGVENNNNSNQNDNSDTNTNSGNENNTEDNFVPYVPSENAKLVGLGIYVFPSNETPNCRDGAAIKGVETTLNDGTVMFTFGQFQAMYFIDASLGEYNVWSMDTRYSSNLVYCRKRLAQRTDGTFSSYMEATYVDTTGRDLSYYIGRIYEDDNQYYLVVDTTREEFIPGQTTTVETVTFYAGEALVEMEVYIALEAEMFDGLYDAYEFIFYNSAGTVVHRVEYTVDNLPVSMDWENNYFRAEANCKYNGEVLFVKDITSNYVYLGGDFVCDTVINGVGYHHNISWVVDN